MPDRIRDEALYYDRTVQDWHYKQLPDNHTAIDLDLMGACAVGWCRAPLYLVEATTNPDKPTSILRALAQRATLPAFVVYHDTLGVSGGRLVYAPFPREPGAAREWVADDLLGILKAIRLAHMVTDHNYKPDSFYNQEEQE